MMWITLICTILNVLLTITFHRMEEHRWSILSSWVGGCSLILFINYLLWAHFRP